MNKKVITLLILIGLAVIPLSILAVGEVGTHRPPGVPAVTDLLVFIDTVIDFVWPVFVVVAIAMFIVAGAMFLMAQGDPGKFALAKQIVIWIIVGIIVAMLGFSVVRILTRLVLPTPVTPTPPAIIMGTCTGYNGTDSCVQESQADCLARVFPGTQFIWTQGATCPAHN